jgi:translation initiation factor 1
MKKNTWKKREGIVYSTQPDFEYQTPSPTGDGTLPAGKQVLRVALDTSGRAGKQVTMVTGFVGSASNLEVLCKLLKTKCGAGGTVKEGIVLIQGDMRAKVKSALEREGYRVRG